MTKNLSICSLISIFLRECNTEQQLFGDLALRVNMILREGVEKNEEYDVVNHFDNYINILASLAKNETKVSLLLDRMWKEIGTF